jgi:hypothetical protein
MREFSFESDGVRLFAVEDGNGPVIAANIPNCTVEPAATVDIAAAIGAFCGQGITIDQDHY